MSPVPRHGKDVESVGVQKFVELPRATSPFYHLPDYTDDDQQDREEGVRSNSGQPQRLDRKNASDSGAAAAR